jgi:hypothetical protein
LDAWISFFLFLELRKGKNMSEILSNNTQDQDDSSLNRNLRQDAIRDIKIFISDTQAVGHEARKDLAEGSVFNRITTIGSIALLGFHEVGMEFTLGRVGVWSFEHWNNPFITGGAMGATSAVIEGALTLGVSASLMNNKRASKAMGERFNSNSDSISDSVSKTGKGIKDNLINAADTAGLALGLGSPGVIIRNHARDNTKTFKEDMKTGSIAAGALAASNFAAGIAASGGLWITNNMLNSQEGSNIALPVLKSPLTYIGLFAITRSMGYVNKRKARNKDKMNQGDQL